MGSCSIREGRFCSLHKLYIEMGGECGWVWRSAWTNFCTIYAKVMKRWLLHVLYLHHPKWRERAPHLPQKCHTCPVTAHSTCGRKVMESLFQAELYRLLCSCFLHPHSESGSFKSQEIFWAELYCVLLQSRPRTFGQGWIRLLLIIQHTGHGLHK